MTKKIVSVEVLHLDVNGYGPEGKHTRREWRAECLEYLLKGETDFLTWQKSWREIAKKNQLIAGFTVITQFDDSTVNKTTGTTVNKTTGISSPTFSHTLDFAGQKFDDGIHVSGYEFLHMTLFESISLQGKGVTFNGVSFENVVSFNGAIFTSPGGFRNTTFKEEAFFTEVTFGWVTNFDNANFQKHTSFEKTYLKNSEFSKTNFNSSVLFTSAIFEGHVKFSGAIFNGKADFNGVSFFCFPNFQHAKFNEEAYFKNAIFKNTSSLGEATFEEATFSKIANFNNVDFKSDIFFTKTKFKSRIEFLACKFEKGGYFENATFENVGHFEQAQFNFIESKIPSFRGVKIDSTRLEFSDDGYFTQNDFTEEAIKNISFLKRLSDEHGQTDQALNFNAMELRAKRKKTWQQFQPDGVLLNLFNHTSWRGAVKLSLLFKGDYWFCFFTYFYEHISDFGRSFTRPFFYLALLFFMSYLFGIFSAFENSPSFTTHSRQSIFSELSRRYDYEGVDLSLYAYRAATEYSLYRTGNFLDLADKDKKTEAVMMRLFGTSIEPWWARLIGVTKGIFSALLLFLTALGLRNKYRVG